MGYTSKFKGAEIDARLEKMVNVTYAELVALRDEGKLIAGQMYRMTDYETTCTWENTQVAGHPFDLVLTALDNKTLDEKCSAIWSERDTDGYFANSNLPAWDVRYCLDNDKGRFDWAQMEGKFLIAYDEWEEYDAVQDGTIEIDGVTYIKWSATNGWAILCTKTASPQYGEEIIVMEIGYEDEPWTAFVKGVEERVGGKGVIYRLIDESENSVPYDFKNIMFSRPLSLIEDHFEYDKNHGEKIFCYTFCDVDVNKNVKDTSVNAMYYGISNNIIEGLCDCLFLGYSIYSNYINNSAAFLHSECTFNTIKDECWSVILKTGCFKNLFVATQHCQLGDYSGHNIVLNECAVHSGAVCLYNTFQKNATVTLPSYVEHCNFEGFGILTLFSNETLSGVNTIRNYSVRFPFEGSTTAKEIEAQINSTSIIYLEITNLRTTIYTINDIINK